LVDVLLNQADVPQKLPEPLQRVVLTLDRHDQLFGSGQGVHREEPQRRRAVQQDEVVASLAHGRQRPFEPGLTRELADQLDLRAGEVDRGRERVEMGDRRRDHRVVERGLGDHDVVDGDIASLMADPHTGRRVALGVEVHHEHPVPELRERRAQTDGGRRLADAALLVRDRDDPCGPRGIGNGGSTAGIGAARGGGRLAADR
jgi:hypothetical protein